MADPSPYTVTYSFSGFQANNPTTPLPAPALDNELANAAFAIASLGAAVKDIRRSDGKLIAGIVTFDSFEQGLKLLIDPTNGQLVAAAVATAQAAQTAASGSATAAGTSATNAAASAAAAATSAAGVNLSLYLAKANNLAGLGSLVTSRSNLGLGSSAVLDVGTTALKVVQLDGAGLLPALDGSQLINIDTLPVGTTIWVNSTAAPAGFLKENGALVSRAAYARLYAFATATAITEGQWAAGNSGAFSTGDLVTTFRLPDARGEFFRAYDDGRGVDSGRTLASHQVDLFKAHTHALIGSSGAGGGIVAINGAAGTVAQDNVTGATGGTETRPRNNAKLACIKY